jgi:transposase-like protein
MYEKKEYSDEFKLAVIKNYLASPHGIRVIARSYDLPSKNYLTNWMKYLVKKGLLSPADCLAKSKSFLNKDKVSPYQTHEVTACEKQLAAENERLRAEVAFLKKLQELERRDLVEKQNISLSMS